jgi:hypothetical protein
MNYISKIWKAIRIDLLNKLKAEKGVKHANISLAAPEESLL